ncbi:UDP-glucuronosyl/UDP-glucosyltransferase [Artemisia annua]|uniref:Glycosyltransferase n=1 Tax=Artemisia annua TaxID=35608 RepID=A0A2U1LID5_ARTAN|nr:UDP-glucuronosyl/UDP-glucosyltransferase [Artemisia annua]
MADTVAELVFIPAPGVGHITSTIEFAKLLVNRDKHISITILVIKPPPGSAMNVYTKLFARKGIDRIRFIELPQDETLPKLDPEAPITYMNEFIKVHCKHVKNIIADMINQSGSNQVAFVIDMFCVSMMDVANEFNIPTYIFFTSSAAFLGYKLYIQTICDTLNQDIFALSNSDSEVQIPSFIKPVQTKVFPAVYQAQEGLDFLVYCVRKFRHAKAIIVNTFLELETHAIESFSSDTTFPPMYPVGPVLNLDVASDTTQDNDVISWLDRQPPASVVFLCFGSMGSFDEAQVKEIARGLERSGHRFLWSLRQSPSPEHAMEVTSDFEDPGEVLPKGFLERTDELGKVIGWAPQVAVLAHPAVGGFVSHCGWNSILESLWFGVPMATWPMYAEQQINAFELVVEMGLAVEIKLDYKINVFNPKGNLVIVAAEEIENGVRQVMEDNKIRFKVKETSKMSRNAVIQGGSSYGYIGSLVQDFMSTT